MHLNDTSVNFMGTSAIVGNSIPIGVGLALSSRIKKTNQISFVFHGDGAVEEGVFFESINFATVKKLPVVFICENNGYAMGTSVERTSNNPDIWKLGLGYEMPAEPVDGMNPAKVARAVSQAIVRARKGDGPTFLEMKTYRYRGHSMSDAQHYRTKDEVEEYKKIDPILQVKKILLEKKYASKNEIEKIREQVQNIL